jgi:hypothetical protein
MNNRGCQNERRTFRCFLSRAEPCTPKGELGCGKSIHTDSSQESEGSGCSTSTSVCRRNRSLKRSASLPSVRNKGCANLRTLKSWKWCCRFGRYPSPRRSAFLDILSGNRSDPMPRLLSPRRFVAGAFGIVPNSTAGPRLQKPRSYALEFIPVGPGNGCRPGRRAAGVILPPPSLRNQEGRKDPRGDSRARFHFCTPPE